MNSDNTILFWLAKFNKIGDVIVSWRVTEDQLILLLPGIFKYQILINEEQDFIDFFFFNIKH